MVGGDILVQVKAEKLVATHSNTRMNVWWQTSVLSEKFWFEQEVAVKDKNEDSTCSYDISIWV